MAVYLNERVRLTPKQEEMCSTPKYQSFYELFAPHVNDEWIVLNDDQVVERAYLRLGDCPDIADVNAYATFAKKVCDNLDMDMYWTWVLYDVYKEASVVSVQDVLDVYDGYRATFSYMVLITSPNSTDVERDYIVREISKKAKEIRNEKIAQMAKEWTMHTLCYTNMVQWIPMELIDQFAYTVLKCSV